MKKRTATIGPAYRQGVRVREAANRWSVFRVPVTVSKNRISMSTRREICALMARAFEAGYELAKRPGAKVTSEGYIA